MLPARRDSFVGLVRLQVLRSPSSLRPPLVASPERTAREAHLHWPRAQLLFFATALCSAIGSESAASATEAATVVRAERTGAARGAGRGQGEEEENKNEGRDTHTTTHKSREVAAQAQRKRVAAPECMYRSSSLRTCSCPTWLHTYPASSTVVIPFGCRVALLEPAANLVPSPCCAHTACAPCVCLAPPSVPTLWSVCLLPSAVRPSSARRGRCTGADWRQSGTWA